MSNVKGQSHEIFGLRFLFHQTASHGPNNQTDFLLNFAEVSHELEDCAVRVTEVSSYFN